MIERLYVNNYHCLENFTFNLKGCPSSLLIGKNGSGKSTVLRSIGLFQKICRGAGRVCDLISINDFSRHRNDRPMRFEVELSLANKKFKYSIALEWPPQFREPRILEESLCVEGESVFNRIKAEVRIESGPSFGLDWHIFALPVITESSGGNSIQELKSFFANMMVIAPLPAVMTGFSAAPSMELDSECANFASCLKELLLQKPAAYQKFDEYLKMLIADFSSIENVSRGESGTQLLVKFASQEHRQSLTVEFKALSDGEKCFFLSAYFIAANSVGTPIVCLWDEPDNHLSLSEVGQFITSLRKMTDQRGQLIATTHHPETVRKFSDETTFVLTRKSHLEPTVIRPLEDFSYTGDLIHALIRDEIIG